MFHPPSAPVRGSVILVVEEDDAERKWCHLILERSGYCVLEARGRLDAWEIAQRYQGRIHLLLIGDRMSPMNGHELSSLVTRVRPETKVLFTSPSQPKALLLTIAGLLTPKQAATREQAAG